MAEWNKENTMYMHNGVLFSHKEQNHIVHWQMDGTGDHYAK
jgi:hypothetical protein